MGQDPRGLTTTHPFSINWSERKNIPALYNQKKSVPTSTVKGRGEILCLC